jgi:CRISPR system Cascade subunit CasC
MFVELHIVQNFAPSCLNRDDTNAPKDCEFGGFRRARISSQCIKRAVRRYFAEHAEELGLVGHLGQRTKLLHEKLVTLLKKEGKDAAQAATLVRFAMEGNGLQMDHEDARTKVLLFLEDQNVEALKNALVACWGELVKAHQAANAPVAGDDRGKKKTTREQKKEKAAQTPESVTKTTTSAADIALFGRMVAELDNMNVDAACQVAHAFSTHEVDMEMDFYTAVDDLQHPLSTAQEKSAVTGDPGAGMIGIVEFNSSCFYRYALLDTAQLQKNFGEDGALCRSAALGFVKAAILAIPTGRQNSMAAQNLPLYVRATVKESAPACSLANAFLKPVRPTRQKEDLGLASVEALEEHEKALARMYGVGARKLDAASSVYKDHGPDTVESLLTKLDQALQ